MKPDAPVTRMVSPAWEESPLVLDATASWADWAAFLMATISAVDLW